jgi:hypothetical protein
VVLGLIPTAFPGGFEGFVGGPVWVLRDGRVIRGEV